MTASSQYLNISLSRPVRRNTRNVSSTRERERKRTRESQSQKYEEKKERRGGLVPRTPRTGDWLSRNDYLVEYLPGREWGAPGSAGWPRREVPGGGRGGGGTEMESSIDKRSGSRGEPFNHATPIKRKGFQCSKWGPRRAASKPNYRHDRADDDDDDDDVGTTIGISDSWPMAAYLFSIAGFTGSSAKR